MQIEWDENKNRTNQKKLGVSFEVAREIFEDPFHISKLDHRFNYFEERWVTIGSAKNNTIIVIANLFFSEDGEEIIRIISAREAGRKERRSYEKC